MQSDLIQEDEPVRAHVTIFLKCNEHHAVPGAPDLHPSYAGPLPQLPSVP